MPDILYVLWVTYFEDSYFIGLVIKKVIIRE